MLTWEPARGGSGSPSMSVPSIWLRQSQAGGSGVAILPGGTSQIPAGTWENTFSSFLLPSCSAGAAAQPPGAFKRRSLLEAGSTLVGNRKGKPKRCAAVPARGKMPAPRGAAASCTQDTPRHPHSCHQHPWGWKRGWRGCFSTLCVRRLPGHHAPVLMPCSNGCFYQKVKIKI